MTRLLNMLYASYIVLNILSYSVVLSATAQGKRQAASFLLHEAKNVLRQKFNGIYLNKMY